MTERPHVSASQVETYRLCPRKWGLNKIDKVKDPGSKYTEFGTALHSVAEGWLRDGEEIPDTKVGKIALAGSKFWPEPGTCEVERYFEIEERGVRFIGYIDVYQERGNSTLILDHKSTGDFKWLKPPAVLKNNVQAMLYAHYGLTCREDVVDPEADLQWVYYLRNRPSSRKVQLRVLPESHHNFAVADKGVRPEHFGCITPEHVEEQWQGILRDGEEMVDIRMSGSTGASLRPDTSACGAYGGCPYYDKECVISAREYLGGIMAQNSLAAKMRGKLSKKGAEKKEAEKPQLVAAPSVPAEQPPAEPAKADEAQAAPAKAEEPKVAKLNVNKAVQEAAAAKPAKAASKAAPAAAKPVNAPESPYAAKITPYQGQAWDTARAILVERAKAGQDLDHESVCAAIEAISKTIESIG